MTQIRTVESVGAKPLLEIQNFSQTYRNAIIDIQKNLNGESPAEFYVTIDDDPKSPEIKFNLWHQASFSPENQNVIGNPGGKCRTIHYSRKSKKISKILFWQ